MDDTEVAKAAECEAERERAEREAERDKGPHRSLAAMLGLSKMKTKVVAKVPVVIDPRLSKVLRPHQIEGVKFLYKAATGAVADGAFGVCL